MGQVRVGSKAPKFQLSDKDGKSYGIDKAGVDFTVLYFYPKDDTPGCTIEAQEFSRTLKDFTSRNVAVIGVSGGDQKTKQKFCSKYKLGVPLVSDTDFSVSRAYGVYGDKKFMGRVYKGIHRKTFIVDKRGTIARIFDSVKPEGHAEEVLKVLDAMLRSEPKAGHGTVKRSVPRAAKTSASKKTKAVPTKVAKSAEASVVRRKSVRAKKPAGKRKK